MPRDAGGIALPGGVAIITVVDTLPDGTPRVHVQRLDPGGAARWGAQGAEVATGAGGQTDPDLVSDGAGGVVVVWADTRPTAPGLYAQRLDATGTRQWGADGVAVALADPAPGPPRVVSDGVGGAIVAWQDRRDGSQYDIYARRVDVGGTPLWANDGVKLCSNALDQIHPTIAADGAGGAIVAWEDQRAGATDLYGQRVNASGVRQWGTTGLAVCTVTAEQLFPVMAASDTFVVLAWQDTRSGTGYSIYAQRLSRSGVASWTAGGVPACLTGGVRGTPVVEGDGAGGVFVAWTEKRFSPNFIDVFAQHLDASGAPLWSSDGTAAFVSVLFADPSLGDGPLPAIAPDGSGGLHVAYTQLDLAHIFELDVTLQHLDATGAPLLIGNGEVLSGAPLDQLLPEMIPDGAGGFIVWWEDHRAFDPDVYAQRRDLAGHDHWAANGTPVYLSPGIQRGQSLVADGAGGVIIAYAQKTGANYDLFARRFDSAGTPLWTTRPVCVAPEAQGAPLMLPDGAGGAFLLWNDFRARHEALYLQRIDATGAALWSPDGVPVKNTADWLETLSMIPDGAGGVIVPFRQLQDVPAGRYDLWVQRFGPDGARRWGDTGQPLNQASNDVPWFPIGVPDGQGGVVMAWEDWYPGDRMFAQRVDSAGAAQWVVGGRLVESTHQSLTLPAIATDGSGGAILAWEDTRAGAAESPDLYAQRLDATGVPVWAAAGIPVSTGSGRQMGPHLLADGAGGAFMTWEDDRGGGADLVGQRFLANGTAQWTGGPRTLAARPGAQEAGGIVPDGAGGFIAAWHDARGGTGSLDIYAQRMDGTGVAQWATDGIPVCTAPSLQRFPMLASDGTSGVFVAWIDARDGRTQPMYLQHLDGSGDTLFVRDGITEVVSSLVRAEATFDAVRLMWQVRGEVAAFDLERRIDGPWQRVGRSSADGSGMIAFEDRDVIAGGRYGYRLGWDAPEGRRVSGEVWLEVPSHATLALSALDPNPSGGPLGVVFTLPHAGAATLEVLDVSGRRVERRVMTALGTGPHRVTLAIDRRLPAGLYLIRLSQDGASVTRKACVLR